MRRIIGSIVVATLMLSSSSFASEKKGPDYTAPFKKLVKEVRASIPNAALTNKEYVENKNRYTLVDIREPNEYAKGYIEGSINLARGKCEKSLPKLLKILPANKKPILLYCNSDKRSVLSANNFIKMGFNVKYLKGGIKAWKKSGKKVIKK